MLATELTIQEAAAEYLAAGLPITLCRGKAPFYGDWQNRRFTPAELDSFFRRQTGLNVGLILGPASRIIDIEGDDEDSEDAYEALFADCEEPVTPTFQSPRGLHRLFAWDERLAALGRASMRLGAIELRLGFRAAQSLLPPSVSDGIARRWLVPLATCPPAPLPETVICRLVT